MWDNWTTGQKTLACVGAFVGILLLIVLVNAIGGFSTVAKKGLKDAPYTYERFNSDWTNYKQYEQQYRDAHREMCKLEAKGKDDSQTYSNYAQQKQGSSQMLARIASNYNKMAITWYEDAWKGKGLPESLTGLPPSVEDIDAEFTTPSTVPIKY